MSSISKLCNLRLMNLRRTFSLLYKRRNALVLIQIFAAFVLSACGGSSQSSQETSFEVISEGYLKNSCELTADDGESRWSVNPVPVPTETYFEKTFDLARLKAVAKLSARAIVDFISADGLSIYQSGRAHSEACANLNFINTAPDDILNIWNDVSRQGSKGSFIVGLYLPTNRLARFGFQQPAVVVRPDTDRYTLVHEYMHYLFDRSRKAQGVTDDKIVASFNLLSESLQSYLKKADDAKQNGHKLNPEEAQGFADTLFSYTDSLLQVMKVFMLEEMTIEAELQKLVAKQEMNLVTDFNAQNSVIYIESSYQRFSSAINSLQQSYEILKYHLAVADRAKISEKLSEQKNKIKNISEQAYSLRQKYVTSRLKEKFATGMGTAPSLRRSCGRLEDLKLPF